LERLAKETSRFGIDSWLSEIVAGVLKTSDILQIDRFELWELLDNLPVAILISTDRACTRIVGNKAAQAMLQVPHGCNFSQSAPVEQRPLFKVYSNDQLVDPDDLPMQRAARIGQRVARSECEIRFEDGPSLYIAGHSIPIHDEDGEVCGSLGAFVDITEHHAKLVRTDILSKEMVHRVKNTVSLIQSLAHNTLRKLIPPSDFVTFENRLISISHAQDLIAEEHVSVDLAALLGRTVEPVVHAFLARVKIEGPAISIPSEMVLSLSMIFHELATNACKYGSLSTAAGQAIIRWAMQKEPTGMRVSLEWLETGGPLIQPVKRSGFGSKLIDRLGKSLPKGRISRTYHPEGFQLKMSFALEYQSVKPVED
jgi:two-component sensor histidine kinase